MILHDLFRADLKIKHKEEVNMKTYKSMLSVVCCWCLCLSLCTVAFAKEAVTQEEVLSPTVELQENDESQAIDKIALQKQKDKEIYDAKMQAKADKKAAMASEITLATDANVNPSNISTITTK